MIQRSAMFLKLVISGEKAKRRFHASPTAHSASGTRISPQNGLRHSHELNSTWRNADSQPGSDQIEGGEQHIGLLHDIRDKA